MRNKFTLQNSGFGFLGVSFPPVYSKGFLLEVMESHLPLVVVIGSSVAEGCYAPTGLGWACLLGKHLEEIGFRFQNEAISG